jgi:ABC-type xylose transport system permease subunit
MTISNQDNISIGERVLAPTPKFFKIIRTFGLLLGTIGGTILAAPVALPVALTTAAGYLIAAGSVAAAISQTTVDWNSYQRQQMSAVPPHN